MIRSFTTLAVAIGLAVTWVPSAGAASKKCSASTNNPAEHAWECEDDVVDTLQYATNLYRCFCTSCKDSVSAKVLSEGNTWTATCANGCGAVVFGEAGKVPEWTIEVTNREVRVVGSGADRRYEWSDSVVRNVYPDYEMHDVISCGPATNFLGELCFTNRIKHLGCPAPPTNHYHDLPNGGTPFSETYSVAFAGGANVAMLSCAREAEGASSAAKEVPAGGIFKITIDDVLPPGFTNIEWDVETTNNEVIVKCVTNAGLSATFKVGKNSAHGEAQIWARINGMDCSASCRASDEPCQSCERRVTIKVGCACNMCEDGAGQCSVTAGTAPDDRGGGDVSLTLNLGSKSGDQVGFVGLRLTTPSAGMVAREKLSPTVDPDVSCTVERDAGGALQKISGEEVLAVFEDLGSGEWAGFRASFLNPQAPEGVPYVKWEVQQIAENQVAVTKYEDNLRKTVALYTYDATDGLWDMSQTDGEGQPLRQFQYGKQALGADLAVESETSIDLQTGQTVMSRQSVKTLADGSRLTLTNETGFGAAWTTTIYEHYVGAGTPEGSWGRLRSERRLPVGDWVRYEYDSVGRPSRTIRPWMGAVFDAPDNACRITTYDYTPIDAGDSANPGAARTVIEWVLGSPVSRTCHAYRPNGGGRELEETIRCSSPTPGDVIAGEASSLIRYGSDYPVAKLRNLPIESTAPDGRLDKYQYEWGDWDGTMFTVRPGGMAMREIATHTIVGSPNGVSGRSTRDISVNDANGHAVYQEQQALVSPGSWVTVDWSRTEIDGLGRPTVVHHANGTFDERVWGCCGVRSQTAADGAQVLYDHDARGRVVEETKVGIVGQSPDIVTRRILDSEGRVLGQVTTSEGLSMTTSNRFDILGRQIWQADAQGRVVEWGYHVSGLIETNTLYGGATIVTERYPDGQTKSVTGTGTTARYYDYGVNADGTRWTCVYTGPDGLASPMWEKTTTDALGRTVRVERPGFGGVVVAQVNQYDSTGRLIKSALVNAQTGDPLQAPTLYAYNEFGEQAVQALAAPTP
jgi:hypothetical protein